MNKSEVIQTRVSKSVKKQLEKQADKKDKTMAEFLRELTEQVATEDDQSRDEGMKRNFLLDIYTSAFGTEDRPGAFDVLERNWETLVGFDGRSDVRELIFDDDREVYVVGQGTSLSVARWFVARLRDRGVSASAMSAENVPLRQLDDDVLFYVSKSGETESVLDLAEAAYEAGDPNDDSTGLTTVGFTVPGSRLSERVDFHVPLAEIPEEASPYATKSVLLQMGVLQTAFFESNPTVEATRERFAHVDEFVSENLSMNAENDQPPRPTGLDDSSQFAQLAEELHREEEQDLDLIVSSVGHFSPFGHEIVQKYSEFLHIHSSYDDLGSIRDRLINILYRGEAYLMVLVPPESSEYDEPADSLDLTVPVPDQDVSMDYWKCTKYLFQNQNSIENLLKFNDRPIPLRLIAITFNDTDTGVEFQCADRSKYRDKAVIQLDSHDPLTDDLTLLMSLYLYVFSVFEILWEYDDEIRREIIRDIWDNRPHIFG